MSTAGRSLSERLRNGRRAIARRVRKTFQLERDKLDNLSGIAYWQERARQYGRRAVLNMRHPEEDYDEVTEMQKQELFPLLTSLLTGNERLCLDFGCGPGRFAPALADLINSRVIAVDPIKRFLDASPQHPCVDYRLMQNNVIPVESASIDIVWMCLVLGGLTDEKDLNAAVAEIDRVTAPNGLIFLVANTTDKVGSPHWRVRPVLFYQRLFPLASLMFLSSYEDMEETISILAGRRHA